MWAERVNLQADELRQGTVYSRRGNSRSEIRICATRVCALQSCPTLCDPMDYIACQAPLSMGFSRQEHWSGLPCPPPGDLPDPGMEPASLMSPALAGRFFTTSATWEAPKIRIQGSKKKKIRKHLMSFPPSSQGGSYNQMPDLIVGLKECWAPY